ncbi:hypothetical protein ACAD32_02215 [Clavibacter nebraskensis]
MNTSSTTPSGRSPLRPARFASVTDVAATVASGAVSVSAMGHNHTQSEPDPCYVGLPSIGEWRHGHHGG